MVKAGDRVGNLWVIDSGLKPGEKVIVEGLQKVKPGVQVSAKTVKPDEETSLLQARRRPRVRPKKRRGNKPWQTSSSAGPSSLSLFRS